MNVREGDKFIFTADAKKEVDELQRKWGESPHVPNIGDVVVFDSFNFNLEFGRFRAENRSCAFSMLTKDMLLLSAHQLAEKPHELTIEVDEDYIAIFGNGVEVVSWTSDEWQEDPSIVPAIVNSVLYAKEHGVEQYALSIRKQWYGRTKEWIVKR